MPPLGNKFYDVLRKHLELGTSLRHINMTEQQKQRTRICMELYNLLKQNPYLNKDEYLKNKYNRTYWEIRHDKQCLDFIISVLDAGGKNITKLQVKTTYEQAIRMAHDQGDVKNMIAGASKLADLERLTEPEQGEDLENSITKLPFVFVDDARKVLPGKSHSNSAQMDRLRKKWGVQKDPHQEMIDRKAEELQAKISEDDRSTDASDGFDLSTLNESQLYALQEALRLRMEAGSGKCRSDMASEISEEEEDDEE